METKLQRNGFTLCLSEPTIYVDNEKRLRSGHMSHALAEFAPNKLIDFNSNCSALRFWGHSTFGWIEYRISEDGGETYGEVKELPYAKRSFIDGMETISVEKAVACDNGDIVAICLRNHPTELCQPWNTPMAVVSHDGGETWDDPVEICKYKGRVYDAAYYKGVIYILEFCNDGTGDFCGEKEEHVYRIYTSKDNGKTYEELCIVPMDSFGRGYGSMVFDDEGRLHVYAYNIKDEVNIDHIISEDCGKTWGKAQPSFVKEGIRNPQVGLIDGVYILHGRAADCKGFVIYSSLDGQNWDEGHYMGRVNAWCYYSNNIVLKDKEGKNRMLIQFSEGYAEQRVNIKHMWIRIEK